jgi:hypothetical protein
MYSKIVATLAVAAAIIAGSLLAQAQDKAKENDPRLDKVLEQNEKILKNQELIIKSLDEIRQDLLQIRRRSS